MNRMNGAHGKRGERLAELQQRVRDVAAREREVQGERADAARRVQELKEQRGEAIAADEAAALGDERPEAAPDLAKTERALAKAASELAADPWSAKLDGLRKVRAKRESEVLRFALDHLAELQSETSGFLGDNNAEIVAALGRLVELLGDRELARQDLAALVALEPPPDDRTTYRVRVPEDAAARRLAGAARQGLGLEPPLPRELAPAEEPDMEDGGPVFEHATGERLA